MPKKTNKVANYFKEVKSELKKVAWPTFKQVRNNTLIVIICVLVVGAFLAVLDLGFSAGFKAIIDKEAPTTQVEQQVETGDAGEETPVEQGEADAN
ncbi:MAG: preprotein translocase subunit SecE [Clostridia bacterium]|nr:preprotein translocase subunit SecE [Clostridia bacterium]MBQ7076331.1 preprotein translocase subunit SecE [Clostridia bacterium]